MIKLESRWSKRGIKKCPKCGTSNGNRTLCCKNKSCRHSFATRPSSTKDEYFSAVQIKHSLEQSVKLYSVRKINSTKMMRGFVEIRDCSDRVEDQLLQHKTAICYVDCQPHPDGTCQHVRVASETKELAEELDFDHEQLSKLNITTGIRNAILEQHLKCRANGIPLVQKVSADTFVVRCDDEYHQYVPFCHVQLKYPERITYDCTAFDSGEGSSYCHHAFIAAAAILSTPKYYPLFRKLIDRVLGSTVPVLDSAVLLTSTDSNFLDTQSGDHLLLTTIGQSDDQMIDCKMDFETELATICLTSPDDENTACPSPIIELVNSNENSTCGTETFATAYADNLQLMDCQIELMDQFSLTDCIDFCPSDIELSDDNFTVDRGLDSAVITIEQPAEATVSSPKQPKPKLLEITTKKVALRHSAKVAKEKLKKGSYNVRRLMRILESNGVVFNRLKRSKAIELAAAGETPLTTDSLPPYEAIACNLSFTCWLESVIEQVNSVIEYGGDGKPSPQVFSIHEDFFSCLRARFSVGHTRRMPDHEVIISHGPRKGLTSQVYKFSCYKSLRNVLKTDKIALKFEKSFCRNADGSFEEIDLCALSRSQTHTTRGPLIKPLQYKTYIKMGTYRSDPSGKVYHFVIEWIAGTLPRTRFGELRFTFEYGHKENHAIVDPPDVRNRISAQDETHS
ncbi:uncharacterized protein C2orf42 homolog [Wyeomyia smithii]|uniref:uncharacterized protein C2orf42 homolog n=1 Tax=Wyeomyia smithii TaxID=174621 RepID=UPI0024680B69|nr:uncharacterized protein C2orf42 homolog [Wyeomyia smithii]